MSLSTEGAHWSLPSANPSSSGVSIVSPALIMGSSGQVPLWTWNSGRGREPLALWSHFRHFLLQACHPPRLLGSSVGPIALISTQLTPPPGWRNVSWSLSYIRCLFASCCFQAPLLLSTKHWFSSPASAHPLAPLSLAHWKQTCRHGVPSTLPCSLPEAKAQDFLLFEWLGKEVAVLQWGGKEEIERGKTPLINFKMFSSYVKC